MFELLQISSLEKVMPRLKLDAEPITKITVLGGEEASYQLALRADFGVEVEIKITSDIAEHITVYSVDCVPVRLAVYSPETVDDNYISKEPGMYPDVLTPVEDGKITAVGYYQSIWITVGKNAPEGVHKIKAELTIAEEMSCCELEYEVLPLRLPERELIFTQWFHADCIANFYNTPVWSERHWELIEDFVRTAADNGINMLLTPIFTPPLDTDVGGERLTVQLVKITKDGEKYTFDFSLLKRWIEVCRTNGIKYFEMAHLFTQWGARFTPKIMAWENGVEKKIFGWEVSATDERYESFLSQLLPSLVDFLKNEGVLENTYFHISDEPSENNLEDYLKAKEIAVRYLQGCKIIDALSDYEFYKRGVVNCPVVATNHIEAFIGKVDELWGYYCCAQLNGVSNRLIAMPSVRNRYMGVQMYKYNMRGFLHWGYNFYNTRFSKRSLNPFFETDAGMGFPAGDSFSVYPGRDGALCSLRLVVFYHAIQDLAALRLLESFIGREKVLELAESFTGELVFSECAADPKTLLDMRSAVNEELRRCAELEK